MCVYTPHTMDNYRVKLYYYYPVLWSLQLNRTWYGVSDNRLASKTTRLYPCGKLIRQTTTRAPRDADIIIISDKTESVTSDTAAKFVTRYRTKRILRKKINNNTTHY